MSGLYGNKFLTETVSLSYDDFIDIYYDSVNESKYLIESMLNESVDLVKVKENIISTIKKLFNGFVKFVSDMFTKLIDSIQNAYNEFARKVDMKLYKDISFKDIQTAYENGFVSEVTEANFLKPEFEIDFIDDNKSSFNEILKKVDNNIEKIFSSFTYSGYDVDLYNNTKQELVNINKKLSEISYANTNISGGFVKANIIKNKSGETEVRLTEETFDIVKKFVFDYRILCKKYKDYSNSIIKDMKSKKDKLESDLKKDKNILKNKNIDDTEKENKIVNNLYTFLYIDRYQTEIKYRSELARWYIKYVKSWHKRSISIYKECIKAVKQYGSSKDDKSNPSIEITDEIKKAVKENDLLKLRIMLKDSLLLDRTFKQFDAYLKYAKDNLKKDLFMDDDGDIDTNKSNWTTDYLNMQMVELVNCFTQKKINHIKEVITEEYRNK